MNGSVSFDCAAEMGFGFIKCQRVSPQTPLWSALRCSDCWKLTLESEEGDLSKIQPFELFWWRKKTCKWNGCSFSHCQLRRDQVYDLDGEIGSSLKLPTAGEVKMSWNRCMFRFLSCEATVSMAGLTLFFSVLSRPLETTPLSSWSEVCQARH